MPLATMLSLYSGKCDVVSILRLAAFTSTDFPGTDFKSLVGPRGFFDVIVPGGGGISTSES